MKPCQGAGGMTPGANLEAPPRDLLSGSRSEETERATWARLACGLSTQYDPDSLQCAMDQSRIACTEPPGPSAPSVPPPSTPRQDSPPRVNPTHTVTPTLPAAFVPRPPLSYASRQADVTLADGDTEALRAALAAATPGQIIELAASVTWTGYFVLPNRSAVPVGDDAWVVIRSSEWQQLPAGRVGPEHAPLMPRLAAHDSRAVLKTELGAHSFYLLGIELTVDEAFDSKHYGLVELGSHDGAYGWGDQDNKLTDLADVVHHITLDRCYIHGHPESQVRVGVEMNGAYQAVLNSHIAEFHEAGADSQAINGWTGPGPLLIENNYLEGAGENIIFGGADPVVPDLVPSDIIVRDNLLQKQLSWKWRTYPTKWVVKNLFELKSARRVLIDNNTFVNNWYQDQVGFAILFTPKNQNGGAPWTAVEDVTFVNNIVSNVASGVRTLAVERPRTRDGCCVRLQLTRSDSCVVRCL